MIKVVFIQRKPRALNYSIEILFSEIRKALPQGYESYVKTLRYFSNGFFRRLYITLEAAFAQKDVNHVTGDINFVAILLQKRRTVLTIHDLEFLNRPHDVTRWLLKWFWVILPVKRAAHVTTISEASKHVLLRHVLIPPHHVHVIYNPVPDEFKPAPRSFNRAMPVLLQIGTKENKNLRRVIYAVAGITCRLDIIGQLSVEMTEELERHKINYTISSRLSAEELIEKYRQADVLIFASTAEGFGMPIVEAQAIGRVVVTSDVSSMPEVAGEGACLVNPYEVQSIREGLLKVIRNDAYREELINKGFVNRERFNTKRIAAQYAEIYNLLAN